MPGRTMAASDKLVLAALAGGLGLFMLWLLKILLWVGIPPDGVLYASVSDKYGALVVIGLVLWFGAFMLLCAGIKVPPVFGVVAWIIVVVMFFGLKVIELELSDIINWIKSWFTEEGA